MSNARTVRLCAAAILAAGILVYANALSGPFLFDDENSILNNPSIRSIGTSLSPPRDTPVAGRPVVNLTFALNYAVGGLAVTGYHVVNVAIHLLAALVLFGIVQRTLRWADIRSAATLTNTVTHTRSASTSATPVGTDFISARTFAGLAVALIFAVHPLQSEAVNYLTERTESLMGLFYLLTLYCSIRSFRLTSSAKAPAAEGRWTTLAIVCCALGMLSKESMVTAPVMVVLYDRVFRFDSLREQFRARRTLYAGLAATWLVLGGVLASRPRTSIGFDAGTSPWVYLLNQAELIPRYLWLTIWPRDLVLDYGLPRALTLGDVLVPGSIVVALIVATVAAFRFAPAVGFLGAWVFITLAPTSSIVPIATEVGAERRMYLALAALAALIVALVDRGLWPFARQADEPRRPRLAGRRRGTLAIVALGVICLLLGAGTIVRNREYASRLTMAQTIVERRPHGRAHFLLGSELLAAGRQDQAMTELRLSARDYPGARFALGTELLGEGKVDEAISELQAFLTAMPNHATAVPARDLLGRAYMSQRRFADAATQFAVIRETAPSYRGASNDILINLGYSLAASGRLAEAVPVLEQAVVANPGDAAVRDLLGRVRNARAPNAVPNRVN
jgi:protein O-mannosyl-transferase